MSDVLGAGLNFPYDEFGGRLSRAVGEASVEAALTMLLSTRVGDRFMLPEYGSELHTLLFDPADEETASLAVVYTREAIKRWIPRITQLVVTTRVKPNEHLIELVINYRYATSPTLHMMVYPFYLQPEL